MQVMCEVAAPPDHHRDFAGPAGTHPLDNRGRLQRRRSCTDLCRDHWPSLHILKRINSLENIGRAMQQQQQQETGDAVVIVSRDLPSMSGNRGSMEQCLASSEAQKRDGLMCDESLSLKVASHVDKMENLVSVVAEICEGYSHQEGCRCQSAESEDKDLIPGRKSTSDVCEDLMNRQSDTISSLADNSLETAKSSEFFSPFPGMKDGPQETLITKDEKAALEPRYSLEISSRASSMDLGPCGPATGYLAESHAAQELFYRLNHARQTVEFVKRQAVSYGKLNRMEMTIWEALDKLDSLREYESALVGSGDDNGDAYCDADMPLMEHALQTAEACRIAFPDTDWMALVGLIHGLGKLMAHQNFGSEPQWAICGESFPVGCRFHPAIIHSQFFQANPDRRRRAYMTATGMYTPGCGLQSVLMSWSYAEYLYLVLLKNRVPLPSEALFLIRYQKFLALFRNNQPYNELLSKSDRAMLPILKKFRELLVYKRRNIPGRLHGKELTAYYDSLIGKYIPQGSLRW